MKSDRAARRDCRRIASCRSTRPSPRFWSLHWCTPSARRLAPLAAASPLPPPPRRSTPASPPLLAASAGRPERRRRLSADGRFAVFESEATNLVTGDTNSRPTSSCVTWPPRPRRGSASTRTARSAAATAAWLVDIGDDGQLDISDDGRYVVFMSRAPLATGDAAVCEYRARPPTAPTSTCAIASPAARPGQRRTGRRTARRRQRRSQDERRRTLGCLRVGGDEPGPRRHQRRHRRLPVRSSVGGDSRISVRGGARPICRASRRTSATTATSSPSSRRRPCTAPIPTRWPATSPPACLRPFVVDRQAGTTRRIPAPAIVTSRVVDTPGGPLLVHLPRRGRAGAGRARRHERRRERQQHRQRDHQLDRVRHGQLDSTTGRWPG